MRIRLLGFAISLFLAVLAFSGQALAQAEPDKDIEQTAQLREAFRQVEGFERVTLEVRGGVAVLRGTVPSYEVRLQAERLAQKLDGILAVDNGLEVERELGRRISPVLSDLQQKSLAIVGQLPLFGVALGLFVLSVWLGRLISRWDWLFSRLSENVFVRDLLRQGSYVTVVLIGALIALEILDATALVGAVLGTAGILGVAVGFAFKDLAENTLASVLLSLRQPFSPNDHVVIDQAEGKVVRLTSRATILLTLDGNHLRIPNAVVFKAKILNYTKNPERRFSFLVGIDTEENLPHAQSLALTTLGESPGVVASPSPQCLVEGLGDSTVNLKIIGWVDQTESEYVKVKSEAIRRVKEAFDQAGVFMPEPIYKIRLEHTEPALSKKTTELGNQRRAGDISLETHLEHRIQEERIQDESDLLSPSAKQE